MRLLHRACRDGDALLTAMLIEAGGNAELKNEDGRTAEELCVVGSETWRVLQGKKNKPLSLLHTCRNFIIKSLYRKRKAEEVGEGPFGSMLNGLGELPCEVEMALEYYF